MNEISKVLQAIDYRSFYQRHIPKFDANGKTEVQCLCPFHEDKNPSLSVNLEKGVFKCFGCGEQGGVVKFIQLRYGLDKKEALRKIKEDERIKSDPELASGRKPKSETRNPKSVHHTLDQVKLIHNQFLKNEAALKTFQGKYGLTAETVEKYLIGYQNGRYVIPIEFEPGKWTFKEHKRFQSLGSKVSLYPPGVIKEGLPYVIIAEGEFKALLLNQLGFQAVSGTGGANTWKPEWNAFFANHSVVIAYDADEHGRSGTEKVTYNLKGIAKSVNIIQWPSYMDSKDKKDVTDFFITLGKTKEDFQRLIDDAKETQIRGNSGCDIILAHPAYEVGSDFLSLGFRETVIEEDKPKDRNFYIIPHNDTFVIQDSSVFQFKGHKIIFDTRERLLVRHQDRWHKDNIQAFINNPTPPKDVYHETKQALTTYIEFPKEEIYGLLSAWVIATYFYQIFYSFPFLFIFGKKMCGKSRLLTLLERLCFNAMKIKGVSLAALADSIDGVRGTFLNDQAEDLSSDKNTELLGILTDSYTKGGGMRRIVNISSNKKRSIMEFETYSPKVFAAIREIDDDLRDRCVEITMLRATRDYPEPEAFLPIWGNLRDKLYRLLLTQWKKAREIYQVTGEGMAHRVRELWRPIETILRLENVSLDDIQNIKDYFLEAMEITQVGLTDREYELFDTLLKMLELEPDRKGIFAIQDIASKVPRDEGVKEKTIQTWVGRLLRQFSLYDYPCGRKENRGSRLYFFSYDHVKGIFDRYRSR